MDEHKVQKWDGPIVVENRQQQIQLRENRKAAPAEIPNKSEKKRRQPERVFPTPRMNESSGKLIIIYLMLMSGVGPPGIFAITCTPDKCGFPGRVNGGLWGYPAMSCGQIRDDRGAVIIR